jgi:hypothetical protein
MGSLNSEFKTFVEVYQGNDPFEDIGVDIKIILQINCEVREIGRKFTDGIICMGSKAAFSEHDD